MVTGTDQSEGATATGSSIPGKPPVPSATPNAAGFQSTVTGVAAPHDDKDSDGNTVTPYNSPSKPHADNKPKEPLTVDVNITTDGTDIDGDHSVSTLARGMEPMEGTATAPNTYDDVVLFDPRLNGNTNSIKSCVMSGDVIQLRKVLFGEKLDLNTIFFHVSGRIVCILNTL